MHKVVARVDKRGFDFWHGFIFDKLIVLYILENKSIMKLLLLIFNIYILLADILTIIYEASF